MAERGLAMYVILSEDAHQSEYVAPYWRARAYMSGFTGSAGVLVVSRTEARLWTDGRYFLQAEAQLAPSGIQLMRSQMPGVPTWVDWIEETAEEGSRIGIDGRTLSVAQARAMRKRWQKKKLELACSEDLVGMLWTDRPTLPADPIFDFPEADAGESRCERLIRLREHMAKQEASYALIGSLEACAWLLNYRGHDVAGTPVAYAYVLVGTEKAELFIEEAKVPAELRAALAADGVEVRPYHEIAAHLQGLSEGSILYDPASLSVRLEEALPAHCSRQEEKDIVTRWKAVKNPVEQEHIREAHRKDGAVMVHFLRGIKEWVRRESIREDEAAAWLDSLRSEQPNSFGISFDTIAGYGPNGAVIHYHAEPGQGAKIEPKGFLLVDSGAQYREGTTDITRTIALGELTEAEKRAYTLVLKGHIALARAVFTDRTTGPHLDAMAREPLWREGMDYRHGTGHGVGYVLSVHEGPQNIGPSNNAVTLQPGMLISDEPGYYEAGQFGIRIENLVLVREKEQTAWGRFLEFETVTLCPYEREAIECSLLNEDEIAWINAYHQRVYDEVSSRLEKEDRQWLAEVTRPL
jgi:Xaa-Pro aminopeptidase